MPGKVHVQYSNSMSESRRRAHCRDCVDSAILRDKVFDKLFILLDLCSAVRRDTAELATIAEQLQGGSPDSLITELIEQSLPTRIHTDRRESLFTVISHMRDMLERVFFLK